MGYLVGYFERSYSSLFSNDNPMAAVDFVNNIDKEHLVKAKMDNTYQIINLEKREYFEPKANKWVPIESK